MSAITVNDLPYQLPRDTTGQLKKLAKITSIPNNLLVGADEVEVEALCYMILYRHLNQNQRYKAMKSIRSVKKQALMGEIINRVLDTTFVNPQWGIWSLSNVELEADIQFHNELNLLSSALGIGASAGSIKEMLEKIKEKKSISQKNWITLVIWGCVYFNAIELEKAATEKAHRTTINSSRFFK
ncbi:hypothetical protein ACXHPE_17480 [Vibrio cincinnatiensis]|uniref:hypothetical protein n=1 Tax=Vibrio cincinnatiensis TaxID=675 RepID=UPI001EE031E5|nr:hypothetical protein [Vibrio cincinnatiensis]MCG3727609.1 hypothetical protein [Vibrio cincinnatiensis]MCG3738129.1 hypothetical protein [Vibrio cincinnatiensis]MCG3744584.1 hypothetical protein [Vibrio cincinnatiensis]MCG3748780.1 hypothetical protein [Vibrio cincinnatiensis]